MMVNSKSPYKTEMRITSLNTDRFRAFFFFKCRRTARVSLPSSNAINRRSLRTLHREQAALLTGTKMGNWGPEVEMNCYGLVVMAERPDTFCPLPHTLQRYYKATKPQAGTKPKQLAILDPSSVCARVSSSLQGCLSCPTMAAMTPAQRDEPLGWTPLGSGKKSQTAVCAKKTNPLEKN